MIGQKMLAILALAQVALGVSKCKFIDHFLEIHGPLGQMMIGPKISNFHLF